MRMNHSRLEFVVDADYGIFSSGAVPGQVYTKPTDSLLQGFSAPSIETEFATDEWGTTLSGYAPIRDQRGMTVGIVGVDIDSNLVIQQLQFIHVMYYAIMILLLVVLVMGALIFDIRRSRAETMLVSANKKLNLLNGIIRHDVINTLTALMGYEEMVEEIAKEPEIRQYLKVISEQTRKIQRQIEFTRDYQDLGLSMPLWQNVEEVAKSAAISIKFGSVALRMELSGIEIYADPHLRTVFSTIFCNSIEHGGSLGWIRGYYEFREPGAVIIIEDNGSGIPENQKEGIFSRKYYKNTGLSLFLIREILAMTELSIRETGEPGKGARFEITVPRNKYRLTGNGPNHSV